MKPAVQVQVGQSRGGDSKWACLEVSCSGRRLHLHFGTWSHDRSEIKNLSCRAFKCGRPLHSSLRASCSAGFIWTPNWLLGKRVRPWEEERAGRYGEGRSCRYSGFSFRPHMGTGKLFVPEGPKSQAGSRTGRLGLPTKYQGPFSE
jgi:hypothetical protein